VGDRSYDFCGEYDDRLFHWQCFYQIKDVEAFLQVSGIEGFLEAAPVEVLVAPVEVLVALVEVLVAPVESILVLHLMAALDKAALVAAVEAALVAALEAALAELKDMINISIRGTDYQMSLQEVQGSPLQY